MPKLSQLPIDEHIGTVVDAVDQHGAIVVTAAPGAGKTTRVPPAILSTLREMGKLVMLQPRRVAARAATARIAQERGWRVGQEIGYQIRFENRTTASTRLVVMTEGILTRRLQSDPFLEDVACVVLDEFHERSIHTDIALAMLQEIRATVRPDLKIVVMSATLQAEPISAFLGGAPVVDVPGRTFPVDVTYLPRLDATGLLEKVATVVRSVLAQPASATGHVLVFLPGMREIKRTQDLLGTNVGEEVHILHSSVSSEDQDRALAPSAKRKVILATNIAETSLTIDGVQTVIDSGYERVALQDSRLGIDRLELRRISKASATQRAGRAGRTEAGRCLRLWTQEEHAALEEHPLPEILRTDLAPTVLALRSYGAPDPATFQWFQRPREADLARAERLLFMLGAIDTAGRLTETGRRLSRIPTHPRIGRLLLVGAEFDVGHEGVALAARLSEGIIDRRRTVVASSGKSDLPGLLEAVLDPGQRFRLKQVEQHFARAIEEFDGQAKSSNLSAEDRLRLCLFLAYPDRLTVRRAHDPSRGVMVGNRGVVLDSSSCVREARLFVSMDPTDAQPTAQGRKYKDQPADESRVTLASAVEEEWLAKYQPHLHELAREAEYDPERDRVLVYQRTRFAGLLISESITGGKDPAGMEAANPLVDYVLSQEALLAAFLSSRRDSADWLSRVQFLSHAMPDLELPELNTEWFRAALETAAFGRNSLASISDQDLLRSFKASLTHAITHTIEKEAPRTFMAPSGSAVRIEYAPYVFSASAPTAAPTASVRLQELFGLQQSPRVAGGRIAVVLHLLSPGFKPVQVTTDLSSFWKNTYAEVRKELRGRYPKHPWPENPLDATPVAIGRRRC